ncbi:hypothetical protein OKA04_03450 [Luteolibacter flavescens]|uniref:Lipoprotein n=1 Tax=Luteolibacter flavescens TaxID=1859460 RepID=A0ABT3FKA0_9BACT|nr:hypothetical protein [Luteolibacter flavescens]MCW1883769.1 hypothetical protein [Luteolibacter flavescens]
MRFLAPVLYLLLASCAAISAKKHTYARGAAVPVNGAQVSLSVKPEGTAGGTFVLSAMVVSGGMATLDGPFRWRIEAQGEPGKQQALVIHRLRTTTSVTKRDEWYPAKHLGRRAEFRTLKGEPALTRAVFEIPGYLEVKPREDGVLTVLADVSVESEGRWERRLLKFRLDPAEKREDEFIFLPAEIVRGIGSDPADWEDPGWD